MPSLKAWEQGCGAPAHLQLVQCPLGQSIRKGCDASITNLVAPEYELL